MMKSIQFTLTMLCTLLASSTVFAKSQQLALDNVVAVVNDTPVLQSEITTASNALKAQLSGAGQPIPPAETLQKKVLEHIIDRKLQLQAAEQAGIKVSDEQINQAIENIAKSNNVSVAELYQKVTTQNLTRAEYRKEIREEMILQQIEQQQVGAKITMTPDDVKNFMHSSEWHAATATPAIKEYHVEDVVVLVPENASLSDIAAAKKQADELVTKAKRGDQYSEMISAADKNMETNDLGWRTLNELPSAFADHIAQAKKGSVIGPLQTGNGFHVIRLAEIREQKTAMQNMAAPTERDAQQMVYQRKFAEMLKKWVARLRSQAVINMHPGNVVPL